LGSLASVVVGSKKSSKSCILPLSSSWVLSKYFFPK
jgi:hypothetical protein